MFSKAGNTLVRWYKKVRYARFVPFYILIWTAFGADPANSWPPAVGYVPIRSWQQSMTQRHLRPNRHATGGPGLS